MIKEFALGLANRHYFRDAADVSEFMNMDSDTFMSLYEYDDEIKSHFSKTKKLSGYSGNIYMPDEFILDVDGAAIEAAINKTKGLIILLNDLDIPFKLFFSGTGFHLHIPSDAFRWKPDRNLHLKVKHA